jgi:hypothetical protein
LLQLHPCGEGVQAKFGGETILSTGSTECYFRKWDFGVDVSWIGDEDIGQWIAGNIVFGNVEAFRGGVVSEEVNIEQYHNDENGE